MIGIAPPASPAERARALKTLGLHPLRRGRAAPTRPMAADADTADRTAGLRAGLVLSGADRIADWTGSDLGRAVLAAAGLQPSEIGPDAGDLAAPRLVLPALAELRSRAAARRALWPQLRRLRRELRG